ncbi:MAG: N-acetyl-gamma-glutamyl-phosphate reductase [Coriobacteriaceae bacterium]|jgi:N-acetyl-gamma-glutamyl-phosphate reductase|nr:N-acetyl-gamma-glutamyl-phosphate reductase [Coriobacteriaceae bacterium]
MSYSVGIVGAAGFVGAELVRLIAGHPDFSLEVVTSDSLAGTSLAAVNPTLAGRERLAFTPHDDGALLDCEGVFLAVPHTKALDLVPVLIDAGVSVFDLSADYRLRDPQVYEAWYGVRHTSPGLLAQAAFGLPELFRTGLAQARLTHMAGDPVLVACAGCYPTASSLAAYPAILAGMVEGTVVIDAISGVTGAGKAATERTHFCFANESLEAYAVAGHRHTPEIEQILGTAGWDSADGLVFTPHLAPLNRGLLATVYLPLKTGAGGKGVPGGTDAPRTLEAMHAVYKDFYRDSRFVQVLDCPQMPKTAHVAGTNFAHIGLAFHEQTGTLIAVAAIDNLCKGAAGQAVQCANIVFDLPEARGLEALAYYV